MNQGPGSFSVLTNRSFRSLTLAGMLWLLGDNIEHVISYWVLFEKFDSPLLAGYAVISHWAPFLLGGILAGSLADRFDCRKLFLTSMVMFMAVSLGWAFVFWTDTLAVWHAVFFLALHGIAGVLFTPASQLIIHDIVRTEDVPSAVRLTATSRQLGLLLGPGVGALLLFALSPEAGLAINACLYLPMVVWSLREPYTGHGQISDAERRQRPISWTLGAVFDSLRLAKLNPTIFGMIAMGGLTSFIVGNAHQAQLPEFAEGFNQDDSGLAYTLLLLAGATGAIVGGLLLELLPRAHPTPRRAIRLAVLWTACMLAFAVAPTYGVGLLSLFLSGVFLIGFTSMAQALVQLEAPLETRGRMIGLFNTSLNGLRVGSGVTVGFVGAAIGIHWSLAISAGVLLLALAGLAIWIPRQRHREPAVEEAPALVEDGIG